MFLFSFTHAHTHTEDDDDWRTVIVHCAPVVIFFNWFNVVSPSKAGGNFSSRTCRILNNISTVYDILWILADAY